MKNPSEDNNLEKRLRGERPEPSADLVGKIASRIQGTRQRRPYRSYRFALAGGLTAALLVALASIGGMGYAANQLTRAVSAVKQTVAPKPERAKIPAALPTAARSQYGGGPPQISKISPNKGCTFQSVTISGKELLFVNSVTFNGTPASFTVVNNDRINATAPDGGTTGPVAVSGGNGSDVDGTFTYLPPKVNGFKPSKAAVGEQTEIKGKCFFNTSSVTFNGVPASYTVNSSRSITATVPVGATDGPVVVTTPHGSDSKDFNVG